MAVANSQPSFSVLLTLCRQAAQAQGIRASSALSFHFEEAKEKLPLHLKEQEDCDVMKLLGLTTPSIMSHCPEEKNNNKQNTRTREPSSSE